MTMPVPVFYTQAENPTAVNYTADTIKAALLTASYTLDVDHSSYADIESAVLTTTTLTGKIFADLGGGEHSFSADNPVFPPVSGTRKHVVLYKDGGILICCYTYTDTLALVSQSIEVDFPSPVFYVNSIGRWTVTVDRNTINKTDGNLVATVEVSRNFTAPASIRLNVSGAKDAVEDHGFGKNYTGSVSADRGSTELQWYHIDDPEAEPMKYYEQSYRVLNFAQGELSRQVTLTIEDNPIYELDRTVTLALGSASAGIAGAPVSFMIRDTNIPTFNYSGNDYRNIINVKDPNKDFDNMATTVARGLTGLNDNGTTENKTNLSAMFTWLRTNGGGLLYFPDPAVSYLLSSESTAPVSANVFQMGDDTNGYQIGIVGESPETKLKCGLANYSDTFWFTNWSAVYDGNPGQIITVKNIYIDANRTINNWYHGLDAHYKFYGKGTTTYKTTIRMENITDYQAKIDAIYIAANLDFKIYNHTSYQPGRCHVCADGGYTTEKYKNLWYHGPNAEVAGVEVNRIDFEPEVYGYNSTTKGDTQKTLDNVYTYDVCLNFGSIATSSMVLRGLHQRNDNDDTIVPWVIVSDATCTVDIYDSDLIIGGTGDNLSGTWAEPGFVNIYNGTITLKQTTESGVPLEYGAAVAVSLWGATTDQYIKCHGVEFICDPGNAATRRSVASDAAYRRSENNCWIILDDCVVGAGFKHLYLNMDNGGSIRTGGLFQINDSTVNINDAAAPLFYVGGDATYHLGLIVDRCQFPNAQKLVQFSYVNTPASSSIQIGESVFDALINNNITSYSGSVIAPAVLTTLFDGTAATRTWLYKITNFADENNPDVAKNAFVNAVTANIVKQCSVIGKDAGNATWVAA